MYILGFDPGASGALAVLEEFGGCLQVRSIIPFDTDEYRLEIENAIFNAGGVEFCIACVEDVHAMPGQGVTSMFSFGRNKGLIEGMLIQAGIKYSLVSPMKWKREFGLLSKGSSKCEMKDASVAKARELFPDANLRPTSRCKKDNDGMAEALLIAEYCRLEYQKQCANRPRPHIGY